MNIAKQFAKPRTPTKSKSRAKQAPARAVVKAPKAVTLELSLLRLDGGTQPRAGLDGPTVQSYAEDLAEGVVFPPVTAFFDGAEYWLADGFHRHQSHKLADKKKIAVDVRQGARRDAILHSVGANQEHGLRRTNGDKHRAILTLLNDAEWVTWSDREIAKACHVDHKTVASIRSEHLGISPDRRTVQRGETTYKMDTSAIGKAANSDTLTAPAEDSAPAQSGAAYDTVSANLLAPSDTAFRDEARQNLPQAIKDREQAKAEWQATSRIGRAAQDALGRVTELEETVRVLEAEAEELRAENKTYREMKVQFEMGGFEKVIADKDEVIRVLETRLYQESADKASWVKYSKYWQAEAKRLGWSNDITIDIETGEVTGG